MNRREFLQLSTVGGLYVIAGGLFGCDIYSKRLEQEVYGLQKDIHLATYTALINGVKEETKGYGVFVDNHYISTNHIADSLNCTNIKTPKGIMVIPMYHNKKMTIKGKLFDIIVENTKNDVLIAKQRHGNDFRNFPAKPTEKIDYGDLVYIIGNPDLDGPNIRPANVSDLDGHIGARSWKKSDAFGISLPLHPGDSGTPIVKIENYELRLMGLAQYVVHEKFGCVNKIKNYTDAIK